MKKAILKIVRTVRTPFYQAMVDAHEEQFLDEEYQIVWNEAQEAGLNFTPDDRVELLKVLSCITHLHVDGVDYFYCDNADVYWEELSIMLDKKENE